MGYVYRRVWPSGKVRFIIAYTDVDGRTKRRVTKAESKLVAKRLLSAAENDVERAKLQGMQSRDTIVTRPEVVTFRAATAEYVKHHASKLKASTKDSYELILEKHLLPSFGSSALRDITIRDVERYMTARLGADNGDGGKIQPATVRNEVHCLSSVFRYAVRSAMVQHNPVRDSQKPRTEQKILRFLDPAEEKEILSRAYSPLREAIVTAIHSGMREGEQAALLWSDVRMDERKIIVRHTKNGRDRAIDMSDTLYETLKSLIRYTDCPYVFVNPRAHERYERFNNTAWRKVLRDADVKSLRWHDLRHTFCSRLAQRGVHPKTIMELSGHSSLSQVERYAHMTPDHRAAAVKVLDQKPKRKAKAQ